VVVNCPPSGSVQHTGLLTAPVACTTKTVTNEASRVVITWQRA
jgi:hypothetical protein